MIGLALAPIVFFMLGIEVEELKCTFIHHTCILYFHLRLLYDVHSAKQIVPYIVEYIIKERNEASNYTQHGNSALRVAISFHPINTLDHTMCTHNSEPILLHSGTANRDTMYIVHK